MAFEKTGHKDTIGTENKGVGPS